MRILDQKLTRSIQQVARAAPGAGWPPRGAGRS